MSMADPYAQVVAPQGLNMSQYGHYRMNPDGSMSQDISDPNAALDAKIATNYGFDAWMLQIPELRTLLERASQPGVGWTQQKFQEELMKTQWWTTHSASQRAWQETVANDPGAADQRRQSQTADIENEAKRLGVTIAPDRLQAMVETSLSAAWDPQQLTAAIAAEYHYDPKALQSGTAATFQQRFKTIAGDYMIPLSDQTLGQWTQDAVSGKTNEDGFRAEMQKQAKSLFPSLSAAIDQGQTVRTYSDPYRQIASRELGIAPESVDFENPKWSRFLNTVDPTTGARTSASLADMTRVIRSDPTYGWDNTSKGREMYSNFAENLLTSFGAVSKGGQPNFQNYAAV